MKKIALIMSMLIMLVSITGCDSQKCEHGKTTPATCAEGEKCKDCGTILGEATEHNWEAATCTSPKTCSLCGKKEGTALGHNWKAATCTIPKTCSRCFEREGEALGHNWEEATCETPKTCSVCNETLGKVGSHDYKNGHCQYCFEKDPYYLNISNNDILTIENLTLYVNSVGGVDIIIDFENRSKKQIAYAYFTFKFYDRMGNPAYCEIQKVHTMCMPYTGPLNAGAFKSGTWKAAIYNSTAAAIKPIIVSVEYTDGSKVTITCDGRYWYSNEYYGGALKD